MATSDTCFSTLAQFFRDRADVSIRVDTRLEEALDSLLFIDLFMHIEAQYGNAVSLDDVTACETFADLSSLLAERGTSGESGLAQ